MKAHDIDIELLIEERVDRVFDAWVNPSRLERWLAPKARVDARRGGRYELFWEPSRPEVNSTRGCKITEIVPNRELSFSWKGPEAFQEVMGTRTAVYLRFEPAEGGTLVRLVHTGWGESTEWQAARRWQLEAWREAFENLKDMIETTDKIAETVSLN